jgi:transcriptional regulator with XRE-family HTH domain
VNPWAVQLAADLDVALQRTGMSQRELARRAEMTSQHVSGLLSAKRKHPPTTRVLQKLAKALGCKLKVIFEPGLED